MTTPPQSGILGTGMIPVATNSHHNPGSSFTANGGSFGRVKYLAMQDTAVVRLVFGNFTTEGNVNPDEVPGPNPIKVRATIEIGSGAVSKYRYTPSTTVYAAGTTYAVGNKVSSGGIYYVSLQASNTGHTPASNPTWWAVINNLSYAPYSSTTTYNPGDFVTTPVVGGFSFCIASTTGNDPPNATYWAVSSSQSAAWDATTGYLTNDMVTGSGLSWVALANNTNSTPSASNMNWRQVQYFPVRFAGIDQNRDVTIAPGEVIASEPCGVNPVIKAATYFYVNTLTQPQGRTDTVTGTSASVTVTDTSISAADQGRRLAPTTGIPENAYVGTVTAGTSFLMSSSPYVQVNVNATANFTTCQILGAPNQGSFPKGIQVRWAGGDIEAHASTGSAPVDYTAGGVVPTSIGADTGNTLSPMVVLGQPSTGVADRKVIGIVGDSIPDGTGDSVSFMSETLGFIARGLCDNVTTPTEALYTWLKLTKSSSAGRYMTGPGVQHFIEMAAGCTHIIDELGVNDLGVSAGTLPLATIQANAVNRWNLWAGLGLKVYATTITPKSTSTDNWATVANQTPFARFGAGSDWATYNTWVKTVPAPLSGVIDVAPAVLNTASGGSNAVGTVWQPGLLYLTDAAGIHPSPAGHIALAGILQTAATSQIGPP